MRICPISRIYPLPVRIPLVADIAASMLGEMTKATRMPFTPVAACGSVLAVHSHARLFFPHYWPPPRGAGVSAKRIVPVGIYLPTLLRHTIASSQRRPNVRCIRDFDSTTKAWPLVIYTLRSFLINGWRIALKLVNENGVVSYPVRRSNNKLNVEHIQLCHDEESHGRRMVLLSGTD